MPWRAPMQYATLWGNAQPTNGPTNANLTTVGNLIQFREAGDVLGMRWYQGPGSTDGSLVLLGLSALLRSVIYRCSPSRISAAPPAGQFKWCHTYFSRPISVNALATWVMWMRGDLVTQYWHSPGVLTGADVSTPYLFAARDGVTQFARNGQTGVNRLTPNTAAPGTLFGVDVIFLPYSLKHPA